MQTFLPYCDFYKSAKVLDRQRLGKQRVECKQILNALCRGGGWKQHPAVRMWRGYSGTLHAYYTCVVLEWKRRGYQHNMTLDEDVYELVRSEPRPWPLWLGSVDFHASHRNKLVMQDPEYYGPLFRDDEQITYLKNYKWPVDKLGLCTINVQPVSMFDL